MTPEDYLSEVHFPLTTQPGLGAEEQLQIDAINYDEWRQARRQGEQLSPEERAVGRELEVKAAARDAVVRQLRERPAGG